jgi:hypothetical protein
MLLVALLFLALTISCVAPISYQVITLSWPSIRVGWRSLLSLVIMVFGGLVMLFGVAPLFAPDPDGVQTMDIQATLSAALPLVILGELLYLLAFVAVGLTIRQLFRKGLSARALAWRIPLAFALGAYAFCLGWIGLLGFWH